MAATTPPLLYYCCSTTTSRSPIYQSCSTTAAPPLLLYYRFSPVPLLQLLYHRWYTTAALPQLPKGYCTTASCQHLYHSCSSTLLYHSFSPAPLPQWFNQDSRGQLYHSCSTTDALLKPFARCSIKLLYHWCSTTSSRRSSITAALPPLLYHFCSTTAVEPQHLACSSATAVLPRCSTMNIYCYLTATMLLLHCRTTTLYYHAAQPQLLARCSSTLLYNSFSPAALQRCSTTACHLLLYHAALPEPLASCSISLPAAHPAKYCSRENAIKRAVKLRVWIPYVNSGASVGRPLIIASRKMGGQRGLGQGLTRGQRPLSLSQTTLSYWRYTGIFKTDPSKISMQVCLFCFYFYELGLSCYVKKIMMSLFTLVVYKKNITMRNKNGDEILNYFSS